ncbi:GNAT family N-acetyltransferase [Simiduia curdlanivorans]|uniref:GNAT family N-acetyltransferase n=1 Tax=Simiduia curdlanivorans TaxID=1492769 RepID=A0ABV8V007_9GAMM|nr:GNAT family N-acetyltransferase [Simiduia curdlanivorans]MDN3637950.1 GNAT family N-acetyltransferase [Simiduia curdlanivorans]
MLNIELVDTIEAIGANTWQSLLRSRYPFGRYDFLHALEQAGCVGAASGWQPQYLVVRNPARQIIACAPLYLKQHSWGEYVFDWAWAEAFQRAGRPYYPKLVAAIPFTPAWGPRMFGQLTPAELLQVQQWLEQHVETEQLSSLHWLLPEAAASEQLSARWAQRQTAQFHWFNRSFNDFNEFLATFNARKRKSLLRERRKVMEQGVHLVRKSGADISAADWRLFYQCYHTTYLKRSGRAGYLNFDFFQRLGEVMAEQMMMVIAQRGEQTIATALCFFDDETLYGRYWGCLEEVECLHFEACYYQGIEFAIARGLKRFDPGAQGEHKIQRGFEPVAVYSNHYIKDTDARAAINHFIAEERNQTQAYLKAARDLLPYKNTDNA